MAKGICRQKSTLPKIFDGSVECGEVGSTISRTLLDTKNTGMYLFLEKLRRAEMSLSGTVSSRTGFGARATKDQDAVWRALKGLTGGMAKRLSCQLDLVMKPATSIGARLWNC